METQHQQDVPVDDPQTPAAMSRAIEAWEAGDFRSARRALRAVQLAELDPELQRIYAQLERGLATDPAIVISGLVFLAVWGWVFWTAAQT